MSEIFSILVIVGIVSSVIRSIKRAPAQRPGPRPAAAPDPKMDAAQAEENEACDSAHEGEASHDSNEGFAREKKPEVHAFSRKVKEIRAQSAPESIAPKARPAAQFSAAEARRAFVMSEILSKPVSMRENNE